MSSFVPPGYELLTVLREQCGEEKLRHDLCTGALTAYAWERTDIREIPQSEWLDDANEVWLRHGSIGRHSHPLPKPIAKWTILVRQTNRSNTTTASSDVKPQNTSERATQYESPYMDLMRRAISHFRIGTADGAKVKKSTIVEWLLDQTLADGKTKLGPTAAEYMATFCRPPEAMKGGNKRI